MTKTSQVSIKALKACNLFASKEATRYYLNGVLLTVSRRESLYVATDGPRMLVHRNCLDDDAPDNKFLGEWILPSESISELKAEKYGKDAALLSAFGNEGKLLLQTNKETILTPIDGTYPNWRRTLPAALNPAEDNGRPQFNLAYCLDFQKASKILGYSALSPHFHYGRADTPCAVTFGHDETFGVIMPVRNNADLWAGAPDWINAPQATAIAAE